LVGNYKEHAAIWDWDGYNNNEENIFWYNWAKKYGKNVLIPMCALGEKGVYMAENGLNVTAFDITHEMVIEGNKRYGNIQNLKIIYGDIRNFQFNIDPIDFVFVLDIQHLLNISDIKNAFISINKHMRKGGCFVIEMDLPSKKSFNWKNKFYYPRKIKYNDKKIWKKGDGYYDPNTKQTHIYQKVFVENKEGIKNFEHKFILQSYDRKEIHEVLIYEGFKIKNEYSDHNFSKYCGENKILIEAIKK